MKVRQILIVVAAYGLMSFAVTAQSAQAKTKPPKPKDYTYCATETKNNETVCFKPPIEVFPRTHTWRFEEETPGTYASGTFTASGGHYVFREETNEHDELIGKKGKHGVISGTLYKSGQPTEFTFTLTPRP